MSTCPSRRSLLSGLARVWLPLVAGALSAVHSAHASTPWPPAWQPGGVETQVDFSPVGFAAPSASGCHRPPSSVETGGLAAQPEAMRRGSAEPASTELRKESRVAASGSRGAADKSVATTSVMPPVPAPVAAAPRALQRPAAETVNAGMVDDNADFGEYLAYRQRHAGLRLRERDISERYLLEVTDRQGRPVHDAEVAVQRAGVAQPVMWARTDTAGRVWIHPRAFLAPGQGEDGPLAVSARQGGAQGRMMLVRGQPQALQISLGTEALSARPRLDLVFLIDATGSMGDEIAKLKASMRAMSQQIAQLPGRPDICYGLVAYRDRGDAFVTRRHDFTDDLGAFQQVLAGVQADGGGDTPEALNEALHETVHKLSWRTGAARLVVLVADAPPHLDYGGPQYDRDMQAALAKGIKLFTVGSSGLDPEGEYVFRQLAQYTAGRFVFLTYRDAAQPGGGPGVSTTHDVKQYSVQTLDRLVVRLVGEELARLART